MRDLPECSLFGFLYITDLTIPLKYRRAGNSDVAAAALVEFFYSEAIRGTFTVVAYTCCAYSDAAVAGAAAADAGTVSAQEDARPFLRVGFKEEVELSRQRGHGSQAVTLYATAGEDYPGNDVYLSHEEACEYSFWAPPSLPPPAAAGKDEELMQLFRAHRGGRTAAFETAVRRIVDQEGASVRRSFALHFCAAQGAEMTDMA